MEAPAGNAGRVKASMAACIGAGGALAAALILLELIKSVRSSFWLPLEWNQWFAVGIAFLVYAAVISCTTCVILGLLRRAGLARENVAVLAASSVALAVLWAVIALLRDDFPSMADVFVAVVAVLWLIGGIVAVWPYAMPLYLFLVFWIVASAAGSIALLTTADALFLHVAHRGDVAALLGLGWAGLSGIGMALVWLVTRSGRHARTSRIFVYVAVLVTPLLLTFLAGRAINGNPATGKPSLLLVTSDALRAQSCATYGGPAPTPALDSLAFEGLLYERAYALCPWTVPSMFGMFSSQYPAALSPGGSREQWREEEAAYVFPEDAVTLAGLLAGKGYATAAFVGNPLLTDPHGILRGFRYTFSCDPHVPLRLGLLDGVPYFASAMLRVWPDLVPVRPVDSSKLLTEYALAFLNRYGRSSFFLWIHYMDPHEPYDPPQEHRAMSGPWPLFCPAAPYWNTPQQADDGRIDVPEEHRDFVRSLYEGEITYMDACLGWVLAEFYRQDLDRNTFVCFASAHGEEFWEHGRFGHGQGLYEELVRVPLLLSGPGIQPGRIATPVSGISIMPTLAQLVQVTPPSQWKGEPLILDPSAGDTPSSPCFIQATNRYAWPAVRQAAVTSKHKLIRDPFSGAFNLFDLETDPSERQDIAQDNPETVESLVQALDEWTRLWRASAAR